VLSTIVARIRGEQTHVPPVVSYDKNERVYNSPMPLLFQWRRRLEDRAVTETSLRGYLDHALTELGIKDAGGHPMRYTFHDFRRLFITDAILHGMPPHIAQLVAGHRDINTTMGYKNSRELHQMGEKPQVVWSAGLRSRAARLWPACA
jgi:integrase